MYLKKVLFIFIFFCNYYISAESILASGKNSEGQLGIGKDVSYEVPVKVLNMSNAVDISAGGTHSLAVKNNGTVWAWGSNDFGQLGDGEIKINKNLPVKVFNIENKDELAGIIKIAGGVGYSLALKADGSVWAWGSNYNGELGTGDWQPYIEFACKVASIDDVVGIAAGDHSYAIRSDGTLWGWGANYFGQIGDGSYEDQYIPVQVKGIDNVKEVDVSGVFKPFSLALKKDGTVWAWGFNTYGQLGTGNNINSIYPVKVLIEGVKQISAGGYHALALKEDGTVWGWGYNKYGQLGNGTNIDSNIPIQIPNLTDIVAVEAGLAHSLFLKKDGTILSSGYNEWGQLGDGTNINRNTPVPVLNLKDIVKISSLYDHNLALDKNGFVWAWGENYYGQIGNGYDRFVRKFESLYNLNDVIEISCGGLHTLALDKNGEVRAWGWNEYGQLGIGEYPNDINVINVNKAAEIPYLKNVISISAGAKHSLALDKNGFVWTWGSNRYGQLGIGSNVKYIAHPIKIPYLEDIIAISAKGERSYALKSDGTVWAWGYNGSGGLGDGTNKDSNIPVQVKNFDNVIAISAGGSFCLALKEDGSVWAWGDNEYGQLGNGSNRDSNLPVQVLGVSKIKYIYAGDMCSFAIDENGKVFAWGSNKYGELGDGTMENSNIPKEIKQFKDIIQIASGYHYTLALDKFGNVWGVGSNYHGQIGIEEFPYTLEVLPISYIKNAISIEAGDESSFVIIKSDHNRPF